MSSKQCVHDCAFPFLSAFIVTSWNLRAPDESDLESSCLHPHVARRLSTQHMPLCDHALTAPSCS